MVWAGPNGFLFARGALDFAGGTVVHINAGVAGLVGAWLVGPRLGFGRESMKPHNVSFTMVGAALLWVGWFGFNAGSNLEANAGASLAFLNTLLATAGAVPSGFLCAGGGVDFAGGTVVHFNAGGAGLVGAWLVGPRLGFGRESMKPHNVSFTMVGAALLWVGWFGFNAGSNLEANAGASLAFLNTLLATAAAVLA